MNTETHEHRKRAPEAGSVAEGETGPSRARMDSDGSPSAQQKLCPPSLAGNVSRVELWEPELMAATVQESGEEINSYLELTMKKKSVLGTMEKTRIS